MDSVISLELTALANSESDTTVVGVDALDSLYGDYQTLVYLRDSVYNLLMENLTDHAEEALSINALLDASEDYEIFQRFLNRLELSRIFIDTLSTADLDSLLWISSLCINEYGTSVIRAHNLLPDTLSYYREPLMYCDDTEELLSSTSGLDIAHTFSIIPNPAGHTLTISTAISGNFFWQVLTSHGEPIISGKLDGTQSVFEIDISSLPVGFYLIKLNFVSGASVSRRFVKLKE